jgi:hypothetical protein
MKMFLFTAKTGSKNAQQNKKVTFMKKKRNTFYFPVETDTLVTVEICAIYTAIEQMWIKNRLLPFVIDNNLFFLSRESVFPCATPIIAHFALKNYP